MTAIENIKINGIKEPIGVETPLFASWNLVSDEKNCVQKSYRICISKRENGAETCFEAFALSDNTIEIPISFDKIESFAKYYIKIAIETCTGTAASAVSSFITGKLSDYEWKGVFISGDDEDESAQRAKHEKSRERDNNKSDINYENSAAHYLKQEFSTAEKSIKSAYIAASALGLYELYVNREKAGDAVLTPGWTSYDKRVQYQLYDVSAHIKQGKNELLLHVGTGWYKGELAFYADRNVYGKRTAGFAELIIEYEDGERLIVATDKTWQTAKSPLVFTEIYHGEIFDARKEDELKWQAAEEVRFNTKKLVSQAGCRVKTHEQFSAVEILKTPKGETVVDFAQNMTGWVTISLDGVPRGTELSFRCFETLDKDGNAYTGNLRRAQQRITYIAKGSAKEQYRPHFSPQEFRYILLEKWYGEAQKEQFSAVALYSDMEKTLSFECSSPLLNQLQHNIEWGMKSNFLDIPLDCPQRNERLGWTGDAQIFSGTASFLFDTKVFYEKWLKDLSLDQYANGEVPHVVPDCITKIGGCNDNKSSGSAAWADAAVINTWNVYLYYGSKEVIKNQFASMKSFVDWMYKCTLFDNWCNRQYGDWVALDAAEGSFKGATPDEVVCYAYEYYSTTLFAKMCGIIGRNAESEKYFEIAEHVKRVFIKKFFQSSGRLKIRTQTAHILALHFHLVPEMWKKRVIADFEELLKERNYHLSTGFVGTPYLLFALSENGRTDSAYKVLLKEDYPSWLYQVKRGATTIWEHWDGIREDGTMWSEEMNSFNHYAYGSVGEWFYKAIAGLESNEKESGFKHFYVRPKISSALSFAKLSYKSVHGEIRISWQKEAEDIRLGVCVPSNTRATIQLENASAIKDSGELCFSETDGIFSAECLSGSYSVLFSVAH